MLYVRLMDGKDSHNCKDYQEYV